MIKFTKTKFIFLSIIFFGFFGVAQISKAAPSVTNVSGTVSHGQNITISGSAFGTKSPAAPLKWDNFESYSVDDNIIITGENPWSNYSTDNWTKASSTQVHSGMKAMHSNYSGGKYAAGVYYDLDTAGGISNCTTVYLSAWVYLKWDATSDYHSRNMKYPRVTAGSADPHTGSPNNAMTTLGNSATGVYSTTVNSFINSGSYIPLMPDAFPEDNWHHFEYYFIRSSIADAADGTAWVSIDGTTWVNSTIAQTWLSDANGGEYYKHVFPGVFYVANDCLNLESNATYWRGAPMMLS